MPRGSSCGRANDEDAVVTFAQEARILQGIDDDPRFVGIQPGNVADLPDGELRRRGAEEQAREPMDREADAGKGHAT